MGPATSLPSQQTTYYLVGWMAYDNDGDRFGGVSLFPKQGSQPAYITTGLVASAQHSLNR
ncbi:hypothetical protein FHU31_005936 [Mycolicibacterium fluoranthenivorans]|uniref:Uncharacterized protein n=2 Tax=Mycolicibacterium fluoranthenivorans TaxID=258505 RepID=A0A7X5U5W5_9MYCO|nr:hypothetical protein [Mycolicibacterium fluoranthenivorans]